MNTELFGDLESGSTMQNQNGSIFAQFSETPKYQDDAFISTSTDCPQKDMPANFITQMKTKMRVAKTVSVFDTAAYIIQKLGPLSSMKLQKLVYYCQVWSLVWDERPLFPERIEAWTNGPVIPDLFAFHRGQFIVNEIPVGIVDNLNATQKETIDAVLDFYGDKPAQWLIDLSHSEKPWKETRKGLIDSETSNREIHLEIIADYYSSISK